MAALTASMISCPVAPVAAKATKAGFNGLARVALPCKAAPSFAQKTLSNGCRTRQMLVWEPVDNKCAPTFKPTFRAYPVTAASTQCCCRCVHPHSWHYAPVMNVCWSLR